MDSSRFIGRLISGLNSSTFTGNMLVVKGSSTVAPADACERLAVSLMLVRRASSRLKVVVVCALALSRGISWTGILTVRPWRPVSELDRRGGWMARGCFEDLRWKASEANLFQAENTSLAASPLTPRESSHSLKISCHLLQASTVQFPIRLSSLAILK